MKAPSHIRLAWGVFILSITLSVLGLIGTWMVRSATTETGWNGNGGLVQNVIAATALSAFSVVGILIATRRPENLIGWILLISGLFWSLTGAVGHYTEYGYAIRPVPAQLWVLALSQMVWVPGIGLAATYGILLFPDGHLPSSRWRWLGWLSGVAIVGGSIGVMFSSSPLATGGVPASVPNPLASLPGAGILDPFGFFIFILLICIVASAVSLVIRLQRSTGEQHEQLRWLAYAALLVGVIYGVVVVISTSIPDTPEWLNLTQFAALYSFALIPIAIGIAVFKYRLYDIDLVISKTLVFGGLAAFITVVYVAIVVGIGRLVGATSGDAGLEILATAVVALLFQPARNRVRKVADRLVYGERATPYAVMADLGRRMADGIAIDRAMPQLAEITAAGVGATTARVRLFVPGGTDRVAVAPAGSPDPEVWATTIDVLHQGEPIGDIAVAKALGDPLRPAEHALLDDLAAQAGLALHNVRLTDELTAKADQLSETAAALEASQRRILSVRDDQRRELEREISEGPRKGLEAISTDLREVADAAVQDPPGAEARLDELGARSNDVLSELRDIARGIFPPLLAERGAVAALDAHIHKVGAHTTLDADPAVATMRFDPEVEACLYFCGVQAIQNVVRHAGNAPAVLRLSLDGDAVRFALTDEGAGFSIGAGTAGRGTQIVLDRLHALDGELTIRSEPGQGTTVDGRIPLAEPVLEGSA